MMICKRSKFLSTLILVLVWVGFCSSTLRVTNYMLWFLIFVEYIIVYSYFSCFMVIMF